MSFEYDGNSGCGDGWGVVAHKRLQKMEEPARHALAKRNLAAAFGRQQVARRLLPFEEVADLLGKTRVGHEEI